MNYIHDKCANDQHNNNNNNNKLIKLNCCCNKLFSILVIIIIVHIFIFIQIELRMSYWCVAGQLKPQDMCLRVSCTYVSRAGVHKRYIPYLPLPELVLHLDGIVYLWRAKSCCSH